MNGPMMNKNINRKKDEQGVALIATLMFLMAMGVLSTALVFTLNGEMRSSASYKYGEQAYYVANAGIQETVQWFGNSYMPYVPATTYDTTTLPVRYGDNPVVLAGQPSTNTSVYPNSSVTTSFRTSFHEMPLQANTANSGAYSLNATLLKYSSAHFINPTTFVSYTSAVERWRLDSVGVWGPNIAQPLGTAQLTAVMENSGNALFDRALWGIDALDLGGTVLVDSYDPDLGPYGGTNIGSQGSVGSNATVTVNGAVTIKGDLAYGPSGSSNISSNSTVTGSIIQLPAPRYFPPIPSFSVGTTNLNPKNGTTTINPGYYGAITIGAKGILALNPGVYYFDSITEAATGSLQINGSLDQDTTIFVKTSLDLSGQGVVNLNGDPTRLTVYYAGTDTLKVAGGASAFVEVYAPNSPLQLVGTSNFYGSFIGKTVAVGGTPDIHFDEGCLEKNLLQRPFRLISWSKNSF
jgi:Tfp pilus assembly protein PilX